MDNHGYNHVGLVVFGNFPKQVSAFFKRVPHVVELESSLRIFHIALLCLIVCGGIVGMRGVIGCCGQSTLS